MKVEIVNYSKMNLKELEKEHTKQNQILLEMLVKGTYSIRDITLQRDRVASIYKHISKKNKSISKQKGLL